MTIAQECFYASGMVPLFSFLSVIFSAISSLSPLAPSDQRTSPLMPSYDCILQNYKCFAFPPCSLDLRVVWIRAHLASCVIYSNGFS
jgi:hypothetical protein